MGNRPSAKIAVTGVDETIAKLRMVEKRLENLQPALNEVRTLFSMMEKEIFNNNGSAPSFGVFNPWPGLADSTNKRIGANFTGRPLINQGYLKDSAENPSVRFFGTNSMDLTVDPRKKGAPKKYSHDFNYGYFHQVDHGGNPPHREFIPTKTMQDPKSIWSRAVNKIMGQYVTDGFMTRSGKADSTADSLSKRAKSKTPNSSGQRAGKAIKNRTSIDASANEGPKRGFRGNQYVNADGTPKKRK